MHLVAKLICEMMANPLAPCLNDMIPNSHSAFIKPKSIHDDFLYVRNTIQWAAVQGKTSFVPQVGHYCCFWLSGMWIYVRTGGEVGLSAKMDILGAVRLALQQNQPSLA
jgi:hypothetical protein